MRISLVPDGVYESYRQITPELLQSKGIRLLLSDLDFTLAPKSTPRPDAAVRQWIDGLRSAGIQVMILTGRESVPVRRRAEELHLDFCVQNCKDKAAYLAGFLKEQGFAKDQVAYVGDDWNDLAAMDLAGFVACPADADELVRRRADFVSPRKGGEGAVRDAVVFLLRRQGRFEALVEQVYGARV